MKVVHGDSPALVRLLHRRAGIRVRPTESGCKEFGCLALQAVRVCSGEEARELIVAKHTGVEVLDDDLKGFIATHLVVDTGPVVAGQSDTLTRVPCWCYDSLVIVLTPVPTGCVVGTPPRQEQSAAEGRGRRPCRTGDCTPGIGEASWLCATQPVPLGEEQPVVIFHPPPDGHKLPSYSQSPSMTAMMSPSCDVRALPVLHVSG